MLGEKNLNSRGSADGKQSIQPTGREQLLEALGSERQEYTISYTDLKKSIEDHYAKIGKKIKLEITYIEDNDDGIYHGSNTLISIVEKTSLLGTETSKKTNIGMNGLKKILAAILELEGKELIGLENNATTASRTIGYGMGEHEETYITGKSFTIITCEKKLNRN